MEPVKIRGMLVFKIAVGNLPKDRADKYIKDMMAKYRRAKTYDPVTGLATSPEIRLPEDVELIFLPSTNSSGTEIQYISFDGTDFNTDDVKELIETGKESLVNVRLSKLEKAKVLEKAKRAGFKTLSEYLRVVALNATLTFTV